MATLSLEFFNKSKILTSYFVMINKSLKNYVKVKKKSINFLLFIN